MAGSCIVSCRTDFAQNITNICNHAADKPSLLFITALLQGQCVSPLIFFLVACPPSKTKATVEAVVYHISNETGVIVCIPETAMRRCLQLARDQPLNNVYHCLLGLFNYLRDIIDQPTRASVF